MAKITSRDVFIGLCGVLALGMVVGGLVTHVGEEAALGGFIASGYAFSFWRRRRNAGLWRQLRDALSGGDADGAERILRLVAAKLDAEERQRTRFDYYEAVLLMLREDWAAALDRIERMPGLPAQTRALWRARCLAELGRVDEARPMLDILLVDGKLRGEQHAAALLALAITQLHERAFSGALTTVDEAERVTTSPGGRAASSFFRAEALRALGREPEARAAYERTIELVPRSRRAAHARERLQVVPPSAYR